MGQGMAAGSERGKLPVSSYRLQLSESFTLQQCSKNLSYFRNLGVSCLSFSHLMQTKKGTGQGRDLLSHQKISSELGGDEGLSQLLSSLKAEQQPIGVCFDIVPHYMSFSFENSMLRDVLQHGPCSQWASLFDIDWESRVAQKNTLALPILVSPYAEALAGNQIRFEFSKEEFGFLFVILTISYQCAQKA